MKNQTGYQIRANSIQRQYQLSSNTHAKNIKQFMKIRDNPPPDPINHVYSLPGKINITKKYFTYRSIQIFKIMFRGFILKNPTKI